MTARLPHCTPTFGSHSSLCDRDGRYCSLVSSHDGACQPHGEYPRPIRRDELASSRRALNVQGASIATIDRHDAAVRRAEGETLAAALRAAKGNPTYSIGDIDPAIVERIVVEIERFRA